ncbi:MAG: paraquat-inducible protein A [Acetobacteraceae bacterium]|nr:paraquat-inducible protein A [Acetobacteraceae bacterium]
MIIACPDCGTIQHVPKLGQWTRLLCCRCGKVLERTAGRSIDAALALSFTTFLLWFPANLATLMTLNIAGIERSSRLGSGAVEMWNEGWLMLAVVVALQGCILPFFRFGLLAAALASIRLNRQGPWTGRIFRWAEHLDLWSMPDVFLFGAAIGYSRVAVRIPVTIEAGGWCLIAAAFFTMMTRASLDRQAVWRCISRPDSPVSGPRLACTECDLVLPIAMSGQRCPRCLARLSRRKRDAVSRAAALVIAGFPLYIISNWFPMSVQLGLGMRENQTIAWGVMQLVDAGFWPLAAIIFTASIVIPLGKLISLSWLLWSVHHHSARRLRTKTRLFRFVEEVGRWSNIDVFTIAIFMPIMQIGGLLSIRAGTGAPAFLSVIVMTMFAARLFDPRLLWDQGEERA